MRIVQYGTSQIEEHCERTLFIIQSPIIIRFQPRNRHKLKKSYRKSSQNNQCDRGVLKYEPSIVLKNKKEVVSRTSRQLRY